MIFNIQKPFKDGGWFVQRASSRLTGVHIEEKPTPAALHDAQHRLRQAALAVRLQVARVRKLQLHRPTLEALHAGLTAQARAHVSDGLGTLVEHDVGLHHEANRGQHRRIAYQKTGFRMRNGDLPTQARD